MLSNMDSTIKTLQCYAISYFAIIQCKISKYVHKHICSYSIVLLFYMIDILLGKLENTTLCDVCMCSQMHSYILVICDMIYAMQCERARLIIINIKSILRSYKISRVNTFDDNQENNDGNNACTKNKRACLSEQIVI